MSFVRQPRSVRVIDPIEERKKLQTSFFRRLFITGRNYGKGIKKDIPFGHYMFCGPQGSGKTSSMLWYFEWLKRHYEKRGFKIGVVYTNFGPFKLVTKESLFKTIYNIAVKKDGSSRFKRDDKIMNFILLDEFHTYFPEDNALTKEDKHYLSLLKKRFSQLRKAHIFVLSTCQVYGDLNIGLRRQCLYMISSRKSKLSNQIVSDFYRKEDILCDDLGNWSGIPSRIWVHGLPQTDYDTSRLVNE